MQACLKAMQDAEKWRSSGLDTLVDMLRKPVSQLTFIADAWDQVVDCRRMLKWTYVYGYYSFEDDSKV